MLELFVDAGDTVDDPIPVAIETNRGLLLAKPRAGRPSVLDALAQAPIICGDCGKDFCSPNAGDEDQD